MKKMFFVAIILIVSVCIILGISFFCSDSTTSESKEKATNTIAALDLSVEDRALLSRFFINESYVVYDFSVSDEYSVCSVYIVTSDGKKNESSLVTNIDVSGDNSNGTFAVYGTDTSEYRFVCCIDDYKVEESINLETDIENCTISIEKGKQKYSINKSEQYTLICENVSDDEGKNLFKKKIVLTFK